eukprot:1356519-Karenia_brevis.AAC.1
MDLLNEQKINLSWFVSLFSKYCSGTHHAPHDGKKGATLCSTVMACKHGVSASKYFIRKIVGDADNPEVVERRLR